MKILTLAKKLDELETRQEKLKKILARYREDPCVVTELAESTNDASRVNTKYNMPCEDWSDLNLPIRAALNKNIARLEEEIKTVKEEICKCAS